MLRLEGGRLKAWLILLSFGRSHFRCGLAPCHLFMAIVCFPVSQLKPDVGSPARFKGERESIRLPDRKRAAPLPSLPAQLPSGSEDLLGCSGLSWKVINSNGAAAVVDFFEVVCRLFTRLALSICKQQQQNPRMVLFTHVFGGAPLIAWANRAARKLQQARGEQSDGGKETEETNTLVKR